MKKEKSIDIPAKLGIEIEIYDGIDQCADEWDSIGDDHIFVLSPYLRTIELSPPAGLIPYYALFRHKDGRIIGKAYFQNKTFRAAESLKITKGNTCPSVFSSIGYFLKKYTSKKVEFESLACGHIMLSGNYAFRFIDGFDRLVQHQLVDSAVQKVCSQIHDKGKDISIIFLKDFEENERFTTQTGVGPSYFEFTIQPGMLLDFLPEWKTEDDYLQAMTSKYRVRFRRARKKLDGVTRRKFELNDVLKYQEELFGLYKAIANNSGFNLFHLTSDYIPTLKRELEEKALIYGYFLNDKIVGFTTLVLSQPYAEAHFIGFDDELNRDYQLYQNMLYDMTIDALANGIQRLDLARTALEIKSTVGAEPRELYCYLRHQKPIHNTIVPQLFRFLSPTEDWQQRRPFKHQSS